MMTYEERGGIVGIYSSGVKMTLKVRKAPMETNFWLPGIKKCFLKPVPTFL